MASFVSLETPPWTVVSTATLDEFASPFRGARRGDLLLVLLLAALVARGLPRVDPEGHGLPGGPDGCLRAGGKGRPRPTPSLPRDPMK